MRRFSPVGWAAAIVASTVVLAATFVWMKATAKYAPPPILPDGFQQPILALELARSAGQVGEILRVPDSRENREVFRRQIHEDWVFIAAYAGLFLALASSQGRSHDPVRLGLGRAIALGILATASFDVFENRGMLGILKANWIDVGDEDVVGVRIWSLGKWLAMFTTCLFAGLLFLDWGRRPGALAGVAWMIAKVTGMLFLASGLIGLRGLASPGFIELAMNFLSVGMLLTSLLAALVFVPWRGHRLRQLVLAGLSPSLPSRVGTD